MTESQVEKLLGELTLTSPGPELDKRVLATINSNPNSLRNEASGNSWRVLGMVAVASLLIGVVVGRELTRPSGLFSLASEPAGTVGPSGRPDDWDSANDILQNPALSLPGPDVSFLCVATPGKTDDEKGGIDQCLTCHDGIGRAMSRFRKAHVQHEKFSTCTVCHESGTQEL